MKLTFNRLIKIFKNFNTYIFIYFVLICYFPLLLERYVQHESKETSMKRLHAHIHVYFYLKFYFEMK